MNPGGRVAGSVPQGLDHLLVGAPDLDEGIAVVERLLGVRPVVGGRHPQYGTRNALLSLGPGRYLEIIAPDPQSPAPERGRLFGLELLEGLRLVTWVLRSDDIGTAAAAAVAAGVDLGPVQSGVRRRPDGGEVRWRLTDPYAMAWDGAVPFLIDWGTTPHPSRTAPRGGELLDVEIAHPRAAEVARTLDILGATARVRTAPRFELTATVRTVAGEVVKLLP